MLSVVMLQPGPRQAEDVTRPQARTQQAAEFLREPGGVPAGDPATQRHTRLNQGLLAPR